MPTSAPHSFRYQPRPYARLAGVVLALFYTLVPLSHASVAYGGDAPWACQPQTGFWTPPEKKGEDWTLVAALCAPADDACPDFVSLSFSEEGQTKALAAAAPPAYDTCSFKWQGRAGRFALYHDNSQLIAVDGDTLRVAAVLSAKTPLYTSARDTLLAIASSDSIVILKPGDATPTVQLQASIENPLRLVWFPERLVVVTTGGFTSWTVDDTGAVGTRVDIPTDALPDPTLYALDPTAVLQVIDEGRRLLWEPWNGDKGRLVSLAENEIVLGIAASDYSAGAITTDGTITRIIARDEQGLRDRITMTKWSLGSNDKENADGTPRRMLLGGNRWLFMDGGTRFTRALPVNTSDFLAWQQIKAVNYRTKGELLTASRKFLLVAHPKSRYALSVWNLPRGDRRRRLPRKKLKKLMGHPTHGQALDKNRFLIKDSEDTAVIFNVRSGSLVAVYPDTVDRAVLTPPMILPGGFFLMNERVAPRELRHSMARRQLRR